MAHPRPNAITTHCSPRPHLHLNKERSFSRIVRDDLVDPGLLRGRQRWVASVPVGKRHRAPSAISSTFAAPRGPAPFSQGQSSSQPLKHLQRCCRRAHINYVNDKRCRVVVKQQTRSSWLKLSRVEPHSTVPSGSASSSSSRSVCSAA